MQMVCAVQDGRKIAHTGSAKMRQWDELLMLPKRKWSARSGRQERSTVLPVER